MAIRSSEIDRVIALDGLRAIFALLVLSLHYSVWFNLPVGSQTLAFLDRTSIYAVCGFFALSGASMALAYSHRGLQTGKDLWQFWLKRFFRIAPLYYLVLFVLVAGRVFRCSVGGECAENLIERLILNVTFTFGLGQAGVNSLVIAGWSIGIEWVFYALFPALLAIAGRSLQQATALILASFMLMVGWDIWYLNTEANDWLVYAQFPAYLFYFVVGMAAAIYRRAPSSIYSYGILVLAMLYVGSHLLLPAYDPDNGFAGPAAWFFAAITCGIVVMGVWAHRPPRAMTAAAVWAGEISYGVYLLHFPVATLVRALPIPPFAGAVLAFVLTIVVARLVYLYFELPAVRFGGRFLKRSQPVVATSKTP